MSISWPAHRADVPHPGSHREPTPYALEAHLRGFSHARRLPFRVRLDPPIASDGWAGGTARPSWTQPRQSDGVRHRPWAVERSLEARSGGSSPTCAHQRAPERAPGPPTDRSEAPRVDPIRGRQKLEAQLTRRVYAW